MELPLGKMPEEVKVDEELQKSLIDIIKSCEDEDKEVYKSQKRLWKKNEEFWHGVQYLFWSQKDDSWRSPMDIGWEDDDDVQEQLGSFSDKVVNIFKAHGESIISALAAQIPSLRFLPDDADDPDDLVTARTYSKVAELVQRHNRAKMIFFRALFFLSLQGIVAAYRYKDSDFKYGSFKVPIYDTQTIETDKFTCKECGYESDQDWTLNDPGPGDFQLGSSCPQCGSVDKPKVDKEKQDIPTIQKTEDMPKSRVKLDIFGPLHFKIPYYARNQEEVTYFILYAEIGKDRVKFAYQDKAEEIEEEYLEDVERFARSIYSSNTDPEPGQKHLVLVKKAWLMPAAFFRENDKHKRDRLIKKFPSGAKVILVGKKNIFIKAFDEDLNRPWQIGQSGLSTFIHSDPILQPLIEICEMRNQLVNLIIETISHGVPSTFADPETLNFDVYGRFEAVPGYIYKAKPRRPGEPLANSFYTSDRATLSREVAVFLKQLDQDAQFCVGSFPSIYGGASEGKSRTFAEYNMSRQMALQRLSIVWHFIKEWWCKTIEGCVELYKECVIEDERYSQFKDGNYINVWIKQAEMKGKVGGVEPEADEAFPSSQAQIKEIILKLMELNNDYINSVLYNPVNARLIQDCFALTDLKVPGEAQRVKQVGETILLLQAPAVNPMQSSVPIDINNDDHAIHIAAIREYVVDQIGMEEKKINPEGFANLLAHEQEHMNAQKLLTIQMNSTPAGVPPETNRGEDVE